MPARNSYVIVIAFIVSLACYLKAERTKHAMPVGDAIFMIDRYYVDEIDRRMLLEGAMQGVVRQLDPYSQFINPESYGHFQDALQQRFAGIGIIVEQPDESERVRVVTPLLKTPAFEAGMRPGDLIMQVDGKDTEGMRISDVSEMLRGPEGTEVKIQVRRGEDELVHMTVRRAWIPLESVMGDHRGQDNKWVFRLEDHPEIAYLRVSTFGEQTVDEITRVLNELDNDFESLVIDLRQNQGGLLAAAVDISDMFIEEGIIVTTRGRGGKLEAEFEATSGCLVDPAKPVVVMIDGESASASEIVSACLKDSGRASIAGERSFGKGTVQNVLPLEAGRSALKLTTARYYRPSGENIHRMEGAEESDAWGVRPSVDLEVKLTDEQREKTLKRLQQAGYPVMDQAEDQVGEPNGEESSLAEQDPQLARVIEFLSESENEGDNPTNPQEIVPAN